MCLFDRCQIEEQDRSDAGGEGGGGGGGSGVLEEWRVKV